MFSPQLIEVEARSNYKLWVKYADGPSGEVDLSDIAGKGEYAAWNDPPFFSGVLIDPETKMISWGNRVEICPDAVYLALTGLPVEALYPDIKEEVWVEDWKVMAGSKGDLPELMEVEARDKLRIWIKFDDGVAGEVDLSHLAGMGVFKAWDDREFFEQVFIGEGGEVSWPNEIDIDQYKLYMDMTGKTVEDLFPGWGEGREVDA